VTYSDLLLYDIENIYFSSQPTDYYSLGYPCFSSFVSARVLNVSYEWKQLLPLYFDVPHGIEIVNKFSGFRMSVAL